MKRAKRGRKRRERSFALRKAGKKAGRNTRKNRLSGTDVCGSERVITIVVLKLPRVVLYH